MRESRGDAEFALLARSSSLYLDECLSIVVRPCLAGLQNGRWLRLHTEPCQTGCRDAAPSEEPQETHSLEPIDRGGATKAWLHTAPNSSSHLLARFSLPVTKKRRSLRNTFIGFIGKFSDSTFCFRTKFEKIPHFVRRIT